jgi:hypothetical protein
VVFVTTSTCRAAGSVNVLACVMTSVPGWLVPAAAASLSVPRPAMEPV